MSALAVRRGPCLAVWVGGGRGAQRYLLDEISETQLVERLLCKAGDLVIVMGEGRVPPRQRGGREQPRARCGCL